METNAGPTRHDHTPLKSEEPAYGAPNAGAAAGSTKPGSPRLKRLAVFDLDVAPTVSPATVTTLTAGGYLNAGNPIVLPGDSGTDKTHVLIGLGIAGCEQARRVRYVTCAQLVNELVEAADERRLAPPRRPRWPSRPAAERRSRLRPARHPRRRAAVPGAHREGRRSPRAGQHPSPQRMGRHHR